MIQELSRIMELQRHVRIREGPNKHNQHILLHFNSGIVENVSVDCFVCSLTGDILQFTFGFSHCASVNVKSPHRTSGSDPTNETT